MEKNDKIITITSENSIWEESKRILVILAHPDDPEFFCGATLARWSREGHSVHYCLLTRGEMGSNSHFKNNGKIISIRQKEQADAAKIIGVESVSYMDNPDGFLVADLELRRDIVKKIRELKPNIVVSCDPTTYFHRSESINHPDHRAAGQGVLEAVFPASQNPDFYPEFLEKGLEPHHVEEVWLSLPNEMNIRVEVTDTWEIKVRALLEHASQIGERKEFLERMEMWAKQSDEAPLIHENFKRLIIRQ